jgi:hypothetical protein
MSSLTQVSITVTATDGVTQATYRIVFETSECPSTVQHPQRHAAGHDGPEAVPQAVERLGGFGTPARAYSAAAAFEEMDGVMDTALDRGRSPSTTIGDGGTRREPVLPEQLRQPRSSSPDRERAQEPAAFFLSETTRRSASLTASAEPK